MTRNELSPVLSDAETARPEPLSLDALLDLALTHSFPASDPPALFSRGSMNRASAAIGKTQDQADALERTNVSEGSATS